MQAPIACCQDNRIKFVHYFGDADALRSSRKSVGVSGDADALVRGQFGTNCLTMQCLYDDAARVVILRFCIYLTDWQTAVAILIF